MTIRIYVRGQWPDRKRRIEQGLLLAPHYYVADTHLRAQRLTRDLQTLPRLDPARIRPHAISLRAGDLDLDDDGFMVRVPEFKVGRDRVVERA